MRSFIFFIAVTCIGMVTMQDGLTEVSIEPTPAITKIEDVSSTIGSTLSTSATVEDITASDAFVTEDHHISSTDIPTSVSKTRYSTTTLPTVSAISASAQSFSVQTTSSNPQKVPLVSVSTAARTTQSSFTSTTPPNILRSRNRQTKKLDNSKQQVQPQLVPLKVIKSDPSEGRSRANTGINIRPGKVAIKVLEAEPLPQLSHNQKTQSTTSGRDENISNIDRKTDKLDRRGKIRYLSGKELGRDDPPINFHSKYETDKFGFSYETKDGQLRSENGVFENIGTEEQNYIVKGSYSYFDEEGIEYIVNYTADNRGYHPIITVNNPNRA